MSDSENEYTRVGQQITGAEQSQMFGKPCYKIGGKAFVCFFQDEMVFKLTGDTHADGLALDGAQLFDPSGKGRAMKEWVQVPFAHKDLWPELASAARQYVGG
ncbi:hypothetical protein [Profundibacter sp.]